MPKILAIDDKADNLITVKALLNHIMPEFEVLTAASGAEGIEIARQQQPDTILLDIIMPQMDGYEVCQVLKGDSQTKHIPVIMLTALRTDTESRIKGLQSGADAFFSKPIDPYELAAQLNVMLRIKKSEDLLRDEKRLLLETVDEKSRALLENEIKLNQIIEGFSIPAFVIDLNHRVTHWNRALETLSKLSAEKMKGTTDHWKMVYKEKRPLMADLVLEQNPDEEFDRLYGDNWQHSRLSPSVYEIESSVHDLFDRERWFFSTAVPILNDENKVISALQTIQEITERKQNEVELNKHRQSLEELIRERTQKLEMQNSDLERMNKLFTGREFRIKELKDRVKELEQKLSEHNIE